MEELGERIATLETQVNNMSLVRDEWRQIVLEKLNKVDERLRTVEKIVWTGVGIIVVVEFVIKTVVKS